MIMTKKFMDILSHIINMPFLSGLILFLFQRKYSLKDKNYEKKEKELEKKGRLDYISKIPHNSQIYEIQLFMSNFKINSFNNNKDIEFYYPENSLDSLNYKHFTIYLQNVGKAAITSFDFCSSNQRFTMLTDIKDAEYIVKNKSINYNYSFTKFFQKNDIIKLDISYPNEMPVSITILYCDIFNNLYEQTLYLSDKEFTAPKRISSKEYTLHTTITTAYECFLNPWMW